MIEAIGYTTYQNALNESTLSTSKPFELKCLAFYFLKLPKEP